QLVEVGNLQPRPEADRAGVRFEFTEHKPDQRRLSRAVRADEADAIAAHHPQRKIFDDRPVAETLAHSFELAHQVARPLPAIETEADTADAVASRSALHAQLLEAPHATLVAGPAGLDSLADPDLFLLPEFLEATPRGVFRG